MLVRFKDSEDNFIGDVHNIGTHNPKGYIGDLVNGTVVASYEEYQDPREERAEVFSRTLDVMNPVWYNSLTTEQQTELAAWRQVWLDYPETGVRPDDLSFM